jgi:hypothetical protein
MWSTTFSKAITLPPSIFLMLKRCSSTQWKFDSRNILSSKKAHSPIFYFYFFRGAYDFKVGSIAQRTQT